MKSYWYIISLSLLLFAYGCDDEKKETQETKHAHKELLKNWADNIIIPAYENYQSKANNLVTSSIAFDSEKTEANFNQLKTDWFEAYNAFQKVLMFDFQHAENVFLTQMANTYPTSPEGIEDNITLIADGKADEISWAPTSSATQQIYQGFPALDYLLFKDAHTLDYYQTEQGKHASTYVLKLAKTLQKNIGIVVNNWKKNKEAYINNTDNSVAGAYNATINAFIYGYEKEIRASKVGYAAGAIPNQQGNPAPQVIEAYYKGDVSKELLRTALNSSRDFFNGKHFSGEGEGVSLASMLNNLGQKDLVDAINSQYDIIDNKIDNLPSDLKELAVNDNETLRDLYDAIQVNVANFKTQMVSALSVQIAYQDTDGD